MLKPILYSFFRSSASYRVRIALGLKSIDYEYRPIHLRKGEQRSTAYLDRNPEGLVPALQWNDGRTYTQSLAIIEFLDEISPSPPLLPRTPPERARVRSLALLIACDVHPVNNLRVLNELRSRFGASDADVAGWYRHWATIAFAALEARLSSESETGVFCHGDAVSLADICVTAQMANNARYGLDLAPYPTISRIVATCEQMPAFKAAAPAYQLDAE
jgi:maleylpyruvate isomerase